jgi:hypothetical protein
MENNQFERFVTSIFICHAETGKEIMGFFNRESWDEVLEAERDTYDDAQRITIGLVITIDDVQYKVVDIQFKLLEKSIKDLSEWGGDQYSPSLVNCVLAIGVEKINS